MTQVWTYADVKAAVMLGVIFGVIGTLTIQFIFRAILFPLLDWLLERAKRRVNQQGMRLKAAPESVNSLAIKDTQS